MAKGATSAILRNLTSRPLATKEVQYKLNQDIDSKVLVSLQDFLQQPNVISRGINQHNVHNYLTTAGFLLVFNPQSQSSKVRLCVDPSRPAKSSQKSVNDSVKAGFLHIPNIAMNLIMSQFNILNCIRDISNFYTNHHLDVPGILLSGIFL